MTKVDFTYDRIRVWIVAVFNPDTQNNLLIKQELFLFSAVGLSGARAGGEGWERRGEVETLDDFTQRSHASSRQSRQATLPQERLANL